MIIPTLSDDFRADLQHSGFQGDIRTDDTTRLLYSTDASIYQIEPLAVVIPTSQEDLCAAVEFCSTRKLPILARGSGSSLAGQAIGRAVILDCSKYLNRLVELDPEARTATVEPGVLMTRLNREAGRYSLQFGPDPASADRASMGGSIANNASGSHSILYGMSADHILAADVLLADGSPARFELENLTDIEKRLSILENHQPLLGNIYRTVLKIRRENSAMIREHWPRTWRRASGYNLNYLLPYSPSAPPQWYGKANSVAYPPVPETAINLATLLAGSEGTLGVIQKLKVGLVPVPRHTILGVLSYDSIPAACDAVAGLLELEPSAIELLPRSLIELARSVPAYAPLVTFVEGSPAALLLIEFSGEQRESLAQKVRGLGREVIVAENPRDQKQIWTVRKVGLGLLQSRYGDFKPLSFIEDLAVPVEHLGRFVREMEQILAEHDAGYEIYAHASAGCLHIRPILNVKTHQGVEALHSIASQAVQLVIRLGGAVSGEHGDGLARTEWMQDLYGPQILRLFREIKEAADPDYRLNPGKIIWPNGSQPARMDANLRYGDKYQASTWIPVMDFSSKVGLAQAIEQCNGAGVCRKSEGVMCPSFQATGEEMHSTRGRANLLRAMIAGQFPGPGSAEKAVYEALDLCLACKGCQAECPSSVDVARLRYEFLHYYYSDQAHTRHHHRMRDYLFGYIEQFARFGHHFAPLANLLMRSQFVRRLADRTLGLAKERPFPELAWRSLQAQRGSTGSGQIGERVLLLSDAFTEYFQPEVGLAALRVLENCGCSVEILPVTGAGRTLISKGFLTQARKHAQQLVEAIHQYDPEGTIPVVGVEPSEVLTLRDEYHDLLPGDASIPALAARSFLLDEFLLRPGRDGRPRIESLLENRTGSINPLLNLPKVLLHTHCYQKAQSPANDGLPSGADAAFSALVRAGFDVEVADSGCCGMAGAFGYEAEHYEISRRIGELALLPAIRSAAEAVVVAAGVSCEAQISDLAGRAAVHPAILLDKYLRQEITARPRPV